MIGTLPMKASSTYYAELISSLKFRKIAQYIILCKSHNSTVNTQWFPKSGCDLQDRQTDWQTGRQTQTDRQAFWRMCGTSPTWNACSPCWTENSQTTLHITVTSLATHTHKQHFSRSFFLTMWPSCVDCSHWSFFLSFTIQWVWDI